MKRDMNLVRDLLLRIEKGAGSSGRMDIQATRGSPQAHHLLLLKDAQLITSNQPNGIPDVSHGGAVWRDLRLTWAGADYLDGVRDLDQWEKVKDTLKKKGLETTVDTVKATVAALAKTALLS